MRNLLLTLVVGASTPVDLIGCRGRRWRRSNAVVGRLSLLAAVLCACALLSEELIEPRTGSFLSGEEQVRLQAAHQMVPGIVPLALARYRRYRDAARVISHRVFRRHRAA